MNSHTTVPVTIATAPITSTRADGVEPRNPALDVIVTGLSSDAHTWNLVYLQLLRRSEMDRIVRP